MHSKTLKPISKNKEPREKYIKKTDYEKFGRYMAEVYETGYIDKWRMYRFSFMKGLIAGFAGVIGATILVALMLWILSFFDSIPLVDRFVRQIERAVTSGQEL